MADVSSLRQQVQTRAARAQVNAAADMHTRYRSAAPYKSGDTFRSIDIVNFTVGRFQLVCTAVATTPQAKWTDEGTEPHVIRARNKKALRFRYRGRIVYAKVVHHPGSRGTRWFSRLGRREWSGSLQRAYQRLG